MIQKIKGEFGYEQSGVLFETISTKDQIKKAFEYINRFPKQALQIAYGLREAPASIKAIAGISLLVGGIGIMNMMLTTVTERTREIGLRKSLGARSKDINNQFLLESISLTFIGGTLGIILGLLASYLISNFGGTTTIVSLSSVLLAFFVSAGIGIIFGYYPAQRASKLNPIEALRYE